MIKHFIFFMALVLTSYASQDLVKRELRNETQTVISMPFQVGFEFQELSSLCLWAQNQNNLKKKPIFSVFISGQERPIFHVEIDDTDVEFVTRPFNPMERDILATTIALVVQSLDLLRISLNEKGEVSFGQWVDLLDNMAKYQDFPVKIKPNMDFSQLGPLRIPERFLPDKIDNPSEGALVIYKNRDWQPIFGPQVTIQHPLEETIPLYFSLFGFDNPLLIDCVSSMPLLGLYNTVLSESDSKRLEDITTILRSKVSGLVFLHALTMLSLVTDRGKPKAQLHPDQQAIAETRKLWEKYMQVDPKIKLLLMSRRPFSEMFKDINQQGYQVIFEQMMGNNFRFTIHENVPGKFKHINYGINLLTTDGRYDSLNFDWFRGYFNPGFVERNEDNLNYLFREGIISTAMIRNLKDEIKADIFSKKYPLNMMFDLYYQQAIESVEFPKSTYRIDRNLGFSLVPSKFDVLSPPWFLDNKYAMGAIKTLRNDDLVYGEAVVEIRSISRVSPRFLRKIKQPDSLTGDFLRKPNSGMVNQALGLFDYLSNFRSPDNIHDITYLGLPYAVLKN
ncbi:MAG: hypothetical protein KF820_05260 [Candidatus Paracaedibacteraceae bacterium]|nr:hypothetical protein [Candidatus Paracaedibacteraceae bacterium]